MRKEERRAYWRNREAQRSGNIDTSFGRGEAISNGGEEKRQHERKIRKWAASVVILTLLLRSGVTLLLALQARVNQYLPIIH